MNDLHEQHLREALEREAEHYESSPDALQAILARTEQTPRLRLVSGGRHHVRTGIIAGVVSAALVAAATIFAVNGGLQRDASPAPVDRPTVTPSGAPAFDPPPPDSTFTLYRVTDVKGEPELTTEMARATLPFDPTQALRTLFSTPALSADSTGPRTGGVQVASTSLSAAAIEVDLAATDAPLPDGPTAARRAATARVWMQAVVRTVQSAYASDLPVRIRLDGRPTTLYGVSTAESIVDLNLPSTEAHEIYLPTNGERVTSPVTLWSSPPKGQWRWQVYDARTGTTVDDGESSNFQGGGSFGAGLDLEPGDYRAVLRGGGGDRSFGQVSFTVTGPAPANPVPRTDPPTTPLPTTPIFWPADTEGRLVRGYVARGTAEEAANQVFDPLVDHAVHTELSPSVVASVRRGDEQIVIELSSVSTEPMADLLGAALARTVNAYYGTELPVRVERSGSAVDLPGAVDGVIGTSAIRRKVETFPFDGLSTEPDQEAPNASPVTFAGSVGKGRTLVYYLQDAVGGVTQRQGLVVAGADGNYAFRLDVAPGRYLLRLDRSGPGEDDNYSSTQDLTVR